MLPKADDCLHGAAGWYRRAAAVERAGRIRAELRFKAG